MVFFGIIILGLLIFYLISYNSRDKTQDYKFNTNYNIYSAEDKLLIDLHVGIKNKVQKALKVATKENTIKATIERRHIIMKAIEEYRDNSFKNAVEIAKQYNIEPMFTMLSINKSCDEAIEEYFNA